jgi:hypothetical protein
MTDHPQLWFPLSQLTWLTNTSNYNHGRFSVPLMTMSTAEYSVLTLQRLYFIHKTYHPILPSIRWSMDNVYTLPRCVLGFHYKAFTMPPLNTCLPAKVSLPCDFTSTMEVPSCTFQIPRYRPLTALLPGLHYAESKQITRLGPSHSRLVVLL